MTTKEFLIEYARRWQQRYSVPYKIAWAKEGALAKKLIATYGEEELRRMVEYFFTSFTSDFADRAGRTVGVFSSLGNAIAASLAEEDKKRNRANQIDTEYERLEDARRKLEGA